MNFELKIMGSKQNYAHHAGYYQLGDIKPHIEEPSKQTTHTESSTDRAPLVILPRSCQTDWTIPAILATIFCFFPTGICAIIAAIEAKSARDIGDYERERSGTTWARRLTLTSIGIGILTIILCIVLYVVLVATVVSMQKGLMDNVSKMGESWSNNDNSMHSVDTGFNSKFSVNSPKHSIIPVGKIFGDDDTGINSKLSLDVPKPSIPPIRKSIFGDDDTGFNPKFSLDVPKPSIPPIGKSIFGLMNNTGFNSKLSLDIPKPSIPPMGKIFGYDDTGFNPKLSLDVPTPSIPPMGKIFSGLFSNREFKANLSPDFPKTSISPMRKDFFGDDDTGF